MLLRRRKQTNNPRVPSGLIAKTEKGYFLVKGLKRFKFVSDRARDSWSIKIVETSEHSLIDIKISGIVGFRDGTLIRDISNHKLYLISDNKKRHVIDPDVLKSLNFTKNNIVLVSHKEATTHQDGESLNVY